MARAAAAILALASPALATLSCLNEAGAPVDWWFIQKTNNGFDYAYVDAKKASNSANLTSTGRSLDCANGCALGATVTQLNTHNSTALRVLWNDELPDDAVADLADTAGTALRGSLGLGSATDGHTKGILASDSAGGFWMTHSLPSYPDMLSPSGFWASASSIYAQSFLCISLNPAMVETVAAGLQYNNPQTYYSFIPATLSKAFPKTAALVAGTRQPGAFQQVVKSAGGQAFTQFAKSSTWNNDLYEALVQPALKVDMLVETWRRSPVENTFCRPTHAWDSINVNACGMRAADGTWQAYSETEDHSKTAVAYKAASTSRWACVGDINRMTSQWTRGGGTVCSTIPVIYSGLSALYTSWDTCAK